MNKLRNTIYAVVLCGCSACGIVPKPTVNLEPLPVMNDNGERPDFLTIEAARQLVKEGTITPLPPNLEHDTSPIAFAMQPNEYMLQKQNSLNHLNYGGGQYSLWQERAALLLYQIEYWLIEHTKLKVQRAYKNGEKPAFMPFLTGGKEGLGTLYPLVDMDENSYLWFFHYLSGKEYIDEKRFSIFMDACFPKFSQYVAKTHPIDEWTLNDERRLCTDMIDKHEIGYHGVERLTPLRTRIVSTLEFTESEPYEVSMFMHLQSVDNLHSISLPEAPRVFAHVARNDTFRPSWAERRYKDAANNIALATFAGAVEYAMFGNETLPDKMRSKKLGAWSLAHKGTATKDNFYWFTECEDRIGSKSKNVAYEHFVHQQYRCYQSDLDMYSNYTGESHYGGFNTDVDFLVLENWKYDQARNNEAQITPGAYAIMRMEDGWDTTNVVNKTKRTEESWSLTLMKRSPAHYFFSWVDKQDGKIVGHVLHHGVHYKYDLTSFPLFMKAAKQRNP